MVEINACRARQAAPAMSSATLLAKAGLLLVVTCTVIPASTVSAQGKPKKKFTKTSGSRASQVNARCTRSIHGDAPVHCSTVGVMIGTLMT